MRVLVTLLAIIYLVGIGVALAPTVRANWQSSTSALYTNVVRALPEAFAWPATAIRSLRAR
jgi:ABC-type arginine transport system permease subunit